MFASLQNSVEGTVRTPYHPGSDGENITPASALSRSGKRLTPTECKVLARMALGESDQQIADHKAMTISAVQTCVRRFRERTGLSGRTLAVWAAKHEECCLNAAG